MVAYVIKEKPNGAVLQKLDSSVLKQLSQHSYVSKKQSLQICPNEL